MHTEFKYFKKIGVIDVSFYKNLFQTNKIDWDNEYTQARAAKATNKVKIHGSSKILPLQYSKGCVDYPAHIPAVKTKFWDEYYNADFFHKLRSLFTYNYGEGYFIRVSFVNLLSNSIVEPHYDFGESLIKNHRIHIPIITNKEVSFTVDDESVNIKEGSIVRVDNSKTHSVQNPSNFDRIHLIVDWHTKYKKTVAQE